jgi:hypothetical protein
MPKNSENSLDMYFNMPNPGLVSYFDMVRNGQPEVYRTPFGKGESVSAILDEWMGHLNKLSEEWPTLLEFENDLAKKVGPMSVMKPLDERMTDIDHYYEDIKLPSKPINPTAIAASLREWGSYRGLHLRNQSTTVLNMRLSTNSGSPYFAKRRTVINKTIPCSLQTYSGNDPRVIQFLHESSLSNEPDARSSDWHACAVLGWRGQEGGPSPEDVKQRVVWMFPFAVNIRELQCYQPLIVAAQRNMVVPAWVSMEAVDRRVTHLFDTKRSDDLVICTDFSRFDQHFNSRMQDAAKSILTHLLAPTPDAEEWLEEVFPIKYMIPLMYDLGKLKTGVHGMGSGSGGTNADETLVHRALQYEAAMSVGARLNPNSQCLGDDGIISYPGCTVEDVVRAYSSHGQEMNPDKQYASKHDCVYLRRWHHDRYRQNGICVGVYSTARALGRLCEQERYYDPDKWSSKMVALRQLSILENVKYHPLRDEFAEFCMKRDKYRLGIDIPGFLDHIEREASEAMELLPDFLGYTKTMQTGADRSANIGISDWWIVNYLKSKA